MTPDLPADMVEAAAQALAQIMGSEGYLFTGRHPHREQDREDYRFNAREILTAALATGEVREEWRVPGIVYVYSSLAEAQTYLTSPVASQPPRVVHRTVFTSPWEEVSD